MSTVIEYTSYIGFIINIDSVIGHATIKYWIVSSVRLFSTTKDYPMILRQTMGCL
jgi:hypothetical protein